MPLRQESQQYAKDGTTRHTGKEDDTKEKQCGQKIHMQNCEATERQDKHGAWIIDKAKIKVCLRAF